MSRLKLALAAGLALALASSASSSPSVRVKDIARLEGVRDNQLVGYGIVVGLAGTGDGNKSSFTLLSVLSMLEKLGISLASNLQQFGIQFDGKSLGTKNAAAVIVTATLPPFASSGQRLDVTISSIGDAESLEGGILLQAPLAAANGKIYAVAQGPISLGGGEGLGGRAGGAGGGSSSAKPHKTGGRVAGGALVERTLSSDMVNPDGTLTWILNRADFQTASRMADAINEGFEPPIARAENAERVRVALPGNYRNDPVRFIAKIEDFLLKPDQRARVVINERTGTIVFGENAVMSAVAVSHAGLTLTIKEEEAPNVGSSGRTGAAAATAKVDERQENTVFMPEGTTVRDVVKALNAVGATPKDIISILQAAAEAGALHAELSFI